MDINKEISDFLRDAQYKLAQLTFQMDGNEDDGDVYYQELKEARWELDYFYSILLETSQQMEGGYNWLTTAEWTEKDILNEIHYLRSKHQMNGMPVLDYQHTTHQIISFINDGGGGSLPTPTAPGLILVSTTTGWEEGTLGDYVGMLDTESLDTYFTGRA